jgi:hypothetical protein
LEKQKGDSRKSLDWDDEASFHSMCARNSRHNSGLGRIKSITNLGTDGKDDSIPTAKLQGSIRKQTNKPVRQLSNITFADEIHQIYLYSEYSDGELDMIASPAKQPNPPQLSQVKPVLARSNSLILKAHPKIQIAA